MSRERQWLPHLAELIDRLTIHQLKEVFLTEHKKKYAGEMKMIVNDVNLILEENCHKITGEMIRAIIVIAQMNTHIWYNESNARLGNEQDLHLLKLTHGLNGLRNDASNYLLELLGYKEKGDYKTDCLAAEFDDWKVSLRDEENNSD